MVCTHSRPTPMQQDLERSSLRLLVPTCWRIGAAYAQRGEPAKVRAPRVTNAGVGDQLGPGMRTDPRSALVGSRTNSGAP